MAGTNGKQKSAGVSGERGAAGTWERITGPSTTRIEDVVPAPTGARAQLIDLLVGQGFTWTMRGGFEIQGVPTGWLGAAWSGGERYLLPTGVILEYTDVPQDEPVREERVYDVFQRNVVPRGLSAAERADHRRMMGDLGYEAVATEVPEWGEPPDGDAESPSPAMIDEVVERGGRRLRIWDRFEVPPWSQAPDGDWHAGPDRARTPVERDARGRR